MNLDNKTTPELLKLQKDIENDPANRNTGGGLHIYSASARKKLDAIARAITHNMAEKRAAEGRPVVADGYSGRKSNRRR